MVYNGQPNPSSFYIQTSMALLCLSIALAGSYLVQNYCLSTKKLTKIQIYITALAVVIFGTCVSYNIVDFRATYNWLIALGILFVMLVELQLLNWGDKTGAIVKIASITLMLSNLFLVIFFITKWEDPKLAFWMNFAITTSLVSFGAGIAFLPRARRKRAEAEAQDAAV